MVNKQHFAGSRVDACLLCPIPPISLCSFLPSLEWYVDSMLTLMERAGESAMNDLWHSVVQVRMGG